MESRDGKPVRAVGFSQNITADRKVEERYQREVGYLRQNDDNNLIAKGHYNLTKNMVLEYTTKNDDFFRMNPGDTYDEGFRHLISLACAAAERLELSDRLDRRKLIDRYQHGQMQTVITYRRAVSGRLPIWIALHVHTYMMPETGDLECFSYAYDVSGKMETDMIMGLISDEEFDFVGLIYAGTDEFEFIKKSPHIGIAGLREKISYSRSCEYVLKNYVSDEEKSRYEDAVALEHIRAGLDRNGGKHVATYRRMENGRVLCKQLDYVWLDRQSGIILAVRSDVTATYLRDQEHLARIEAAKLEAERANEAKSTFLSGMSHDLRTPLNGVIGFTDLALKEADPEKKQDYLRKIDSSGRLLLALVNDTLELSRIESGKAVLEPEAVKPSELVPAVVTALRPSAELRGIRMETDFTEEGSIPLWCDRLKVQKIALNLISNSIKYTPEGGRVLVSTSLSDSDRGCIWTLRVEDSGIGMSEEFMKRMYEPFAQEKRSESLKTPGTGLGLSIVRRYVDLMEGTISTESRIHEGTKWVISLPVRQIRESVQQERESADDAFLAGKRVLLCEDNYMNTEIAVMLLKDRGISAECAENGEAGFRMFRDSPCGYYDAILMDLRMPVMDGKTAARKIRSLERTDARTVPIAAMTADAFAESIREAQEAGMDGYLTKPIEPEKMFRELTRIMKKIKAQNQNRGYDSGEPGRDHRESRHAEAL